MKNEIKKLNSLLGLNQKLKILNSEREVGKFLLENKKNEDCSNADMAETRVNKFYQLVK